MIDYKQLRKSVLDQGPAGKFLPLSSLLDALTHRATFLANELSTPGLDPTKTEFLRGARFEALSLLQALKD